MFGPFSPWPQCSWAPSSVTQWLLYRTVLITVLFAVASTEDWCNHLQSDFTGHVQTIGPLDGRLWAITTEWTVHEMTPCDKGNETLSLCMEIGFPVQVDTKWPELAKSVKENANVTDFNFTVDNSVFMDSSENSHFLIMHGKDFKPTKFFGFNFSANEPTGMDGTDIYNSVWISSDGKNKTCRLYDSGKSLVQIVFSSEDGIWSIHDKPGTFEHICNVTKGSELLLNITTDDCLSNMTWTVKKAVRYGDQFYFFAQDQVYIFTAVENVTTRVDTVHYDSFINCKGPTFREHNLSFDSYGMTTKGSKTLIYVAVGVATIVVMNAIIIIVICYLTRNKSTQKEGAQSCIGSCWQLVSSNSQAGPTLKVKFQAGPGYNIDPSFFDHEKFMVPTMPSSTNSFTTYPNVRTCKRCKKSVITEVEFTPGLVAWIVSIIFFCCGLVIGCWLIPLYLDCVCDYEHKCPHCGRSIGRLTRKDIICQWVNSLRYRNVSQDLCDPLSQQ